MSTDTITISEAVKLLGIPQESVFDEFCLISIKKADVTAIFNRRLLALGQPVAVVAPGKPPREQKRRWVPPLVHGVRRTRSGHAVALPVKPLPERATAVFLVDIALKVKATAASVRDRAVTRAMQMYYRKRREHKALQYRRCLCVSHADAKILHDLYNNPSK